MLTRLLFVGALRREESGLISYSDTLQLLYLESDQYDTISTGLRRIARLFLMRSGKIFRVESRIHNELSVTWTRLYFAFTFFLLLPT